MIRVIIADDEVLVRIGLKAAIDWEKNGFVIVDEVGNGWNALARVREGVADILLLDIRMPLMDGIEVMKVIKQEKLPVKVIILSVHEEGMYVKEALALGAFDYMLKLSLDPERLLQTLCRARDELEPGLRQQPGNPQSKQWVRKQWLALIERYDERMFRILRENGSRLTQGKIALLLVRRETETGQAAGPAEAAASQTVSPKYIENIITDTINNYAAGDCLQWKDDLYIAIINPRLVGDERLQMVADAVSQSIRKYTNSCVTIGVSGVREGLAQLQQALREAEQALSDCYVPGKGSIRIARRYEPGGSAGEIFSLKDEQRFLFALEQEDEAAALAALRRFGETVRSKPFIERRVITEKAYDIVFIALRVMREVGVRLEKHPMFMGDQPKQHIERFAFFSETEAFLAELAEVCIRRLRKLREENTQHRAITEAKAYIRANINQPMSLDILSKRVNLSKNHFSHLFKKETGENVSSFILRTRIEYSKKLLSGTSLSVSEVAQQSSFSDIYYFSNAFKKLCGMSPTEYKRKIEQQSKPE